MKKEQKAGRKASYRITQLDPYMRGAIRRAMLQELRQVIQNKEYREKRLLTEEPMNKLGKDSWILHILLESIEESTSKANVDIAKVHKDSMWMLDNIKTELDDLFKQSVEAEKRLKAASTQYEAAIFKSIEETSEAINGAYQRLTSIDQNLVKLENSMKMELQTRMANLTQKFDEIRESINATLKENKERIAYLWQQIEDSEKRIKDATMTSERNLMGTLDQLSAQAEGVSARILEMHTIVEQSKEESRTDLVQVGNELMEAVALNLSTIQDFQGKTGGTLNEMSDKLSTSLDEKLEALRTELLETQQTTLEELTANMDSKLDAQGKALKKDTNVLLEGVTALKSELEVLKHITLDAIKTTSRR
jgi:hypothetical protein